MAGLDVKLIPEFDGSGEDHVVDWIEKVEMVCTLQTPAAPQDVSSASNKADTLTRVPEKWMKGRTANGDAAAVADSGGAAVSDTAAAGGTASSDSDGDAVNAALGTAGPAPARGDGDGETTTSGNGRQEDDDALLNER
ncbi:hypothetical protein FJT64_022620 [Amphibalanus amphitrite]|uniref:Uncharacterized protein n=1 Tax=Amphibalanus amphitrite TaxID=1232801 RepID=A0A6A4WU87_AMPAM|nr:hypothetical protein FJT64_026469 [Amphibalanus amphitrite]KAF0305818.1 hypothetical protein FJT64_022620 [Amphibalanus amphitrite]